MALTSSKSWIAVGDEAGLLDGVVHDHLLVVHVSPPAEGVAGVKGSPSEGDAFHPLTPATPSATRRFRTNRSDHAAPGADAVVAPGPVPVAAPDADAVAVPVAVADAVPDADAEARERSSGTDTEAETDTAVR